MEAITGRVLCEVNSVVSFAQSNATYLTANGLENSWAVQDKYLYVPVGRAERAADGLSFHYPTLDGGLLRFPLRQGKESPLYFRCLMNDPKVDGDTGPLPKSVWLSQNNSDARVCIARTGHDAGLINSTSRETRLDIFNYVSSVKPNSATVVYLNERSTINEVVAITAEFVILCERYCVRPAGTPPVKRVFALSAADGRERWSCSGPWLDCHPIGSDQHPLATDYLVVRSDSGALWQISLEDGVSSSTRIALSPKHHADTLMPSANGGICAAQLAETDDGGLKLVLRILSDGEEYTLESEELFSSEDLGECDFAQTGEQLVGLLLLDVAQKVSWILASITVEGGTSGQLASGRWKILKFNLTTRTLAISELSPSALNKLKESGITQILSRGKEPLLRTDRGEIVQITLPSS